MAERAQVFVVDREAFFGGNWPQGYHQIADGDQFLQQARALGRFVDRDEAEANPAWKQWIPYCMLRCGNWSLPDADADRGILLVQRTNKGGEARLHESWSIGLGGHIEPVDLASGDLETAGLERAGVDGQAGPAARYPEQFFAGALQRELAEELVLPPTEQVPSPKLLGLINDDSTEVGRVHAGLAYCIDFPVPLSVARETVGIREISKMRGGFTHLVELAKLWQTRAQFESWSQFLIQAEIVDAMGHAPGSAASPAETQLRPS